MIAPSEIITKPIKGLSTIRIVDLVSSDNDKRYAPAGLMATAIIEIMQENKECLPHYLNAKGFGPDEIAQHWHLAKSLAAIEMRLMGAAATKTKSIFENVKL